MDNNYFSPRGTTTLLMIEASTTPAKCGWISLTFSGAPSGEVYVYLDMLILSMITRFLPYVGMVTIQLTDYPALKYVLVGVMGLFVITAKE